MCCVTKLLQNKKKRKRKKEKTLFMNRKKSYKQRYEQVFNNFYTNL